MIMIIMMIIIMMMMIMISNDNDNDNDDTINGFHSLMKQSMRAKSNNFGVNNMTLGTVSRVAQMHVGV